MGGRKAGRLALPRSSRPGMYSRRYSNTYRRSDGRADGRSGAERPQRSAQSGGCGSARGEGEKGTGGAKGNPSTHRAASVFPERSSPPRCLFGMRLTHGDSPVPEPIIIIIILNYFFFYSFPPFSSSFFFHEASHFKLLFFFLSFFFFCPFVLFHGASPFHRHSFFIIIIVFFLFPLCSFSRSSASQLLLFFITIVFAFFLFLLPHGGHPELHIPPFNNSAQERSGARGQRTAQRVPAGGHTRKPALNYSWGVIKSRIFLDKSTRRSVHIYCGAEYIRSTLRSGCVR